MILALVGLLVGIAIGLAIVRWGVERTPVSTPAPRAPSTRVTDRRVTVYFHFADGTVDVKRLFDWSLEGTVLWRGRSFTRRAIPHEGVHVYDEVTGGR